MTPRDILHYTALSEVGGAKAARHLRAHPGQMPIIGLGVVLALLLAVPGQTATTKYVNDLFIFLDGVHRIWQGQVPNVDFHTSLGPLNYYLPAMGYGLSGSLAAAMPVGLALFVLVLAFVAAHVIGTRMRPAIGLPLASFLLLIAAVPVNPGEPVTDLSFAMFYNRVGWSTIGLLLVMYLPRAQSSPHAALLDALCAALLVLVMLYTKMSYGLVGLAFLGFMLLDREQWRWAGLALAVIAASCLAVEFAWGGTAAHLADLRLAGEVSGSLPSLPQISFTMQANLPDIVIYSVFALLLLAYRRSLRDFLFLGFCGGAGILIIEQNFQRWDILTLAAAAAVAAEALARTPAAASKTRLVPLAAGGSLLLLVFLLPTIVHNTLAMGLHGWLAATRQGDQIPLPRFTGIRLVEPYPGAHQYQWFVNYNETLADGVQALAALGRTPSNVMVLDFVGPFSAGLNLVPPRGDGTWYHWDRTINQRVHPPASDLFQDIQIVMDPKLPIERYTAEGMRRVYADYLARHYELAVETTFWRVYTVRTSSAPRLSRHSDAISTARQRTSAQP